MRLNHRSVLITNRSSVGEARRAALAAATALGFGEDRRSNIGIVATELASNIVMHAGEGEFLVCPSLERETAWLDLIALDKGPGIGDIGRAREDGFSTAGTAGHGLGAIERLSERSSLYTAPGKGTAAWSRFGLGEPVAAQAVGVVNIPIKGESVCGDSVSMRVGAERSLYMVVDGLGHGPGAAEAAEAAVATVARFAQESPAEILLRAHDALKTTRGAAMSIAVVDLARRDITYAGVGNITAMLVRSGQVRSMVSQNGTLGAVLPRQVQEFHYPLESDTMLTMFSDGLTTRAGFTGYPGLLLRPAPLLAGVLYRDFTRGRDDATALIAPLRGTER